MTPQREAGGRRDLPPLKGGLPPSSPGGIRPLEASVGIAGSMSSADTGASGSAGDAPPALEGAPETDGDAKAPPPPASAPAMVPMSAQLGGAGSSFGWIFRCVITTKAGRCVVNCAHHASADGVRAGEGGSLAVGPLCRLLVTMHDFSQGGFLSYVQSRTSGWCSSMVARTSSA